MAGDRPGGRAVIPQLPAAEVRAAIADEDWDLASSLVQAYGEAVVAAASAVDFDREPRGPWLDLLAAQRILADEILSARDAAAHALEKLGRDQRGARAWHRALA
jgi:hypothetical protein